MSCWSNEARRKDSVTEPLRIDVVLRLAVLLVERLGTPRMLAVRSASSPINEAPVKEDIFLARFAMLPDMLDKSRDRDRSDPGEGHKVGDCGDDVGDGSSGNAGTEGCRLPS